MINLDLSQRQLDQYGWLMCFHQDHLRRCEEVPGTDTQTQQDIDNVALSSTPKTSQPRDEPTVGPEQTQKYILALKGVSKGQSSPLYHPY